MIGWLLVPAFFCVACLYASAGFAGGSPYTALLALAESLGNGFDFRWIRPISYLCNLVVSAGGVAILYRDRMLPYWGACAILLASIPATFFAAGIPLSRHAFLLALCIALFVAELALLSQRSRTDGCDLRSWTWREALRGGLPIGLIIGTLAGITESVAGSIYLHGCTCEARDKPNRSWRCAAC
jgi:hypothetical protein